MGSSNRSLSEFLEILEAYGIKVLADVRRFPTSKFDQFKKENLERTVEAAGIEYVYLGKELGGYRSGGYARYMGSPAFQEGIEVLLEVVKGEKGCILCAERLPWRCHRRFIAQALRNKRMEVIHIIEKGRTWREEVGEE